MYEITKIRENLNMTANAVNGMMTTTDEAEKNAWITIYNARMKNIFDLLDDVDKPVVAECAPNPDAPAEQMVEPADAIADAPVEADAPAEQMAEPADGATFNE